VRKNATSQIASVSPIKYGKRAGKPNAAKSQHGNKKIDADVAHAQNSKHHDDAEPRSKIAPNGQINRTTNSGDRKLDRIPAINGAANIRRRKVDLTATHRNAEHRTGGGIRDRLQRPQPRIERQILKQKDPDRLRKQDDRHDRRRAPFAEAK